MATGRKSDRGEKTPCDITPKWNHKNKINEQTRQKQTHQHKKQTDAHQIRGAWRDSEKGEIANCHFYQVMGIKSTVSRMYRDTVAIL